METSQRAIGVTLILISLIIFTIIATIRKRKQHEEKRRIMEEGVEANATVLNITPTGEYQNNLPEFQVKVKVEPEAGGPFVAEMTEVFTYSKYDLIRQGSAVLVKYDPVSFKRAIFVNLMEAVS